MPSPSPETAAANIKHSSAPSQINIRPQVHMEHSPRMAHNTYHNESEIVEITLGLLSDHGEVNEGGNEVSNNVCNKFLTRFLTSF